MSITEFFKRLGAPLANTRWSWGAVREADGVVFLRVWQDRKYVEDRRPVVMVTHHARFADDQENLGYVERLEHVQRVRDGAPCMMVMCLADDPAAVPRKIKSFNTQHLFVAGEVVEKDGDTWLRVAEKVSAREQMRRG